METVFVATGTAMGICILFALVVGAAAQSVIVWRNWRDGHEEDPNDSE